MNELDPTPIVKQAGTFAERMAEASVATKAWEGFGRKSLEAAQAAGRALIAAKAQCEHGQWIPSLAEKGIDRCTAARLMRYARDAAKCVNLPHLSQLRSITEDVAEETEPDPREIGDEPEEPPAPLILCKRCKRTGAAKDCKGCAEARTRKAGRKTPVARRAPSKNGKPLFDWRGWENQFRPVAQTVDRIVRVWPEQKNTPEYREALDHLSAFYKAIEAMKARVTRSPK